MGYAAIHDRLEQRGLIGSGGLGHIQCPAHDDARGSLSITEAEDDKALVYCHAGCSPEDVVEAIGLGVSDLFGGTSGKHQVARYVYNDDKGQPVYRVIRTDPKGFFQERFEDGEWKPGMREVARFPYQLSEWKDEPHVVITEGEKDADALRERGIAATTLVGGAGKWRPEYAEWFAGKKVSIYADNDDPGKEGASKVALALADVAKDVNIFLPREGKDVSDHLDAGYHLGEMVLYEQGLDELGPLDWETYEASETEWLLKPYVPVASRVLAYGAAGSLKSLWAMWLAARLSREGRRVAYFSLEMRPSDTTKRLKQLAPDPKFFSLFTKFNFRSTQQVMLIIDKLKGYDLIVVDSWSASHQNGNDNEEVASLDAQVFQPIIDGTGASLLILDNTGHPTRDNDGEHKQQHARGASAKGDKMEVTLWFDRPVPENNYRTRVKWTKMRLDEPIPPPVVMETPRDTIEFYEVHDGFRTEALVWPYENGSASSAPPTSPAILDTAISAAQRPVNDAVPAKEPADPVRTLKEKLAYARLVSILGATEIDDAQDA